jgi:hypothetical protein
MPKTLFTATFSNGTKKTRRSARPYTHAFRVIAAWQVTEEYLLAGGNRFYPNNKAGDLVTRTEFGFSSSERLARVAADRFAQGFRRPGVTTSIEVVPVEVA